MSEGQLVGICIAVSGSEAMNSVGEAEAVAGQGLVGDRYANLKGTFQEGDKVEPDQEVTLIEQEALEGASREYSLEVAHRDSRRNLLTRGVALNHLVGQQFQVGEVTLEGMRLCEPCAHLEKLTQEGVRQSLIHRGGLRARIVQGGILRLDDAIRS